MQNHASIAAWVACETHCNIWGMHACRLHLLGMGQVQGASILNQDLHLEDAHTNAIWILHGIA